MPTVPESTFRPTQIHTRECGVLLVREYDAGDFAALVEMYKGFEPKRVAQGLPPPDVPRIAQWLDQLQQKSRALLALDGKRVVAHAILCPISDAAVEYSVFVHQDFRRQGVGSALTRRALELAGELEFAEAILTTELSNFSAIHLYQKAGFQMKSAYAGECEMSVRVARAQREERRAA